MPSALNQLISCLSICRIKCKCKSKCSNCMSIELELEEGPKSKSITPQTSSSKNNSPIIINKNESNGITSTI